MKRTFLKFSGFLLAMAFVASCSNDDMDDPNIDDDGTPDTEEETPTEPIGFVDMESDWVRLSLMGNNKIDVMQADNGEIHHTVEGELAEGERYYTSNSGRYLTAIDREGSRLRFFDSGIQKHDDHGHEYTAKWLDVMVDAPLPTHYASSGGHIVLFNDGNGSITHVDEAQLEIPAYSPEVFALVAGTVAHHGAGFRLDNGMYATTFKNTDEPGGIPQMVKYVDADGMVIDDNGGIEVEGIHGDAVNGQYGVFGSTDGVILVDNQNNIDLIPNIGGLNAESGNWLGTLKGHDNAAMFFARSGNLGVFMVNPSSKTMTALYAGDDVLGDMFSFDGAYYLVHTADSKVHVFDSSTGAEIAERTVEMADIPELSAKGLSEESLLMKDEEPSPVLVTSDDFLYVLAPNRTQIKVLEIADLEHVHTIELEAPVESIMKNGFSIEGDQNPDHDH